MFAYWLHLQSCVTVVYFVWDRWTLLQVSCSGDMLPHFSFQRALNYLLAVSCFQGELHNIWKVDLYIHWTLGLKDAQSSILRTTSILHTSNRPVCLSLLLRTIKFSDHDFVLTSDFQANVWAEIRSSTGIDYWELSFFPFILDYMYSALQPKWNLIFLLWPHLNVDNTKH